MVIRETHGIAAFEKAGRPGEWSAMGSGTFENRRGNDTETGDRKSVV